MVCLCGCTIYRKRANIDFPPIPDHLLLSLATVSCGKAIWRDLALQYISSSSVNLLLLRSQFAGFLGGVTLTDENAKKDADNLTSEGVLLKPNPAMACYRMASPLVDGVICRRKSYVYILLYRGNVTVNVIMVYIQVGNG